MTTQELTPDFVPQSEEVAKLNRWLFEIIKPYIKGRVLELNSSINSISSVFVKEKVAIHLSNSNLSICNQLYEIYKNTPIISSIQKLDFNRPNFTKVYSPISDLFNTIIALNIDGSGFYNSIELQNAKDLLLRRGHLVVLQPLFVALYENKNISIDDWARYNKQPHRSFFGGYEILRLKYFTLSLNSNEKPSKTDKLVTLTVAKKI